MPIPWDPTIDWENALQTLPGTTHYRTAINAIKDQLYERVFYPASPNVTYNFADDWEDLPPGAPPAGSFYAPFWIEGGEFYQSPAIVDRFLDWLAIQFLDNELKDWSRLTMTKIEERLGSSRPYAGSGVSPITGEWGTGEGKVKLTPTQIKWFYDALNMMKYKTFFTEYWDGLKYSTDSNLVIDRAQQGPTTVTGDTTNFNQRWSISTGGFYSEPWKMSTSPGLILVNSKSSTVNRDKNYVHLDMKYQFGIPPIGASAPQPDSEWDGEILAYNVWSFPFTSSVIYNPRWVPKVVFRFGFYRIQYGGVDPVSSEVDFDIMTLVGEGGGFYSISKYTYIHPHISQIGGALQIRSPLSKDYAFASWRIVHRRVGETFIAELYFTKANTTLEYLLLRYESDDEMLTRHAIYAHIENGKRIFWLRRITVRAGNGELK